jgi:phosphotransferase system  glucose/maltose/N-acetylglucosamine-specific IIC component
MNTKQQTKQIERELRLHTLRTWAFGIAIASGTTAFFSAGGHSLSNIETWSSSFVVMAGTGLLQKSWIPLVIITIIFLVIGFILHFVMKRMETADKP